MALTDHVTVNETDSFCNAGATTARLHIIPENNDMIVGLVSMVFHFTGVGLYMYVCGCACEREKETHDSLFYIKLCVELQ